MENDPIMSSPAVKRQKTAGGFRPAGGRRPQTQTQTNTSGTIPTQILSRPPPQASLTFANLMADLTADSQPSYHTQPTQPLPAAHKRSHSSTPTVQVARSSPAPVPESPLPQPRPQTTFGARFA
ncbi:hypothetical protein KCU78_g19790, partial [Aureobasidium melanogenum]